MKFVQIIQSIVCSVFIFSSCFMVGSQREWFIMPHPTVNLEKPCFGGIISFDGDKMNLKVNKHYFLHENSLVFNEVKNIDPIEIPLSQIPSYFTMDDQSSIVYLSKNKNQGPQKPFYFRVENKDYVQEYLCKLKDKGKPILESKIKKPSSSSSSSDEEAKGQDFIEALVLNEKDEGESILKSNVKKSSSSSSSDEEANDHDLELISSSFDQICIMDSLNDIRLGMSHRVINSDLVVNKNDQCKAVTDGKTIWNIDRKDLIRIYDQMKKVDWMFQDNAFIRCVSTDVRFVDIVLVVDKHTYDKMQTVVNNNNNKLGSPEVIKSETQPLKRLKNLAIGTSVCIGFTALVCFLIQMHYGISFEEIRNFCFN